MKSVRILLLSYDTLLYLKLYAFKYTAGCPLNIQYIKYKYFKNTKEKNMIVFGHSIKNNNNITHVYIY